MRILAISDERDPALTAARCREIRPDLVVSCGNLEPAYVDFVASAANATIVFVPGNEDADLRRDPRPLLPAPVSFESMWGSYEGSDSGRLPGTSLDGEIMSIAGVTLAGLGGSIRHEEGPNQYTERQMARRVKRLERRLLLRRKQLDVLIAHSPPSEIVSNNEDLYQGFACFTSLIEGRKPRLMLHGHVLSDVPEEVDRQIGETRVVNVSPHRVIEL